MWLYLFGLGLVALVVFSYYYFFTYCIFRCDSFRCAVLLFLAASSLGACLCGNREINMMMMMMMMINGAHRVSSASRLRQVLSCSIKRTKLILSLTSSCIVLSIFYCKAVAIELVYNCFRLQD